MRSGAERMKSVPRFVTNAVSTVAPFSYSTEHGAMTWFTPAPPAPIPRFVKYGENRK